MRPPMSRPKENPFFEAFSVTSVLSVVNHSHKVAVAMIIAYMSNIQTAGESPCSACSDLL